MTELQERPVLVQELGSLKDAQTVVEYQHGSLDELPSGWKKIGGGSYRRAYLSPDGIVYKVGYFSSLNCMQLYEVVFLHLHAGESWAPPAWLWLVRLGHLTQEEYGVVAMPYMPKDADHRATFELEKVVGWRDGGSRLVSDLSTENVAELEDGTVVIRDAGNLTTRGKAQVQAVIDQLKAAGWTDGTSASWSLDPY